MKVFDLSILNPFDKKEVQYFNQTEKQVLEYYNSISWFEWIKDAFSKYNEIDINTFWYFECSFNNKCILTISTNFASNSSFNKENMFFYISYLRPKKVKRFFGLLPDKLKLKNIYITNLNEEQTKNCLTDFLLNETDNFEKIINNYTR